MRDLHIKSKSKVSTVYEVFQLFYLWSYTYNFFSATSNKKQLPMSDLWGKGQGGEVNRFFILYLF